MNPTQFKSALEPARAADTATAPDLTDRSVAVAVNFSEAQLKLAIKRAEALHNFYSAERRAGATPLEANERMHFFAMRLDAPSPLDVELDAIREIMESAS
jgi:hypothetical protein